MAHRREASPRFSNSFIGRRTNYLGLPSWRRPVGFALTAAALLLFLFTVVTAGLAVARTPAALAAPETPYPLREECEELAEHLPETIPSRLRFVIHDEDGGFLSEETRAHIQKEFERGLERYPFLNVEFVFDASFGAQSDDHDTHHVPVAVWLNRSFYPESESKPGIPQKAEGQMCGNLLNIEHGDAEGYDAWTFAHELGHFLGLPHHDGTFMNGDGLRSARFDKLSACQEEILAQWVPGEPYTRHWDRAHRHECVKKDNFLVASINHALYRAYGI